MIHNKWQSRIKACKSQQSSHFLENYESQLKDLIIQLDISPTSKLQRKEKGKVQSLQTDFELHGAYTKQQ